MKPGWQWGRLDLSIQAGRSFCFRFSISIFAPPIWHELLQRDSLPLFKVLHNLHFFIFFIQLIKELSTRSTRHTASHAIRALSRNAIKCFTFVCPLFTYILRAATRSAHKLRTPLQLSMQKPVKISPFSASIAHTT